MKLGPPPRTLFKTHNPHTRRYTLMHTQAQSYYGHFLWPDCCRAIFRRCAALWKIYRRDVSFWCHLLPFSVPVVCSSSSRSELFVFCFLRAKLHKTLFLDLSGRAESRNRPAAAELKHNSDLRGMRSDCLNECAEVGDSPRPLEESSARPA